MSLSNIQKASLLLPIPYHSENHGYPSFLRARGSSSFKPFDLFSAIHPKHPTFQNPPGGVARISIQLTMWFFLTEVKTLKQLVRNIIDPDRDLGHVDRSHHAKKPRSISNGKPSMSAGQSPTEKAEVNSTWYRRTTSSTNIPKVPQDVQEQAIPIDAAAAVARSAASEDDRRQEKNKERTPGGGEPCEDC